MYYLCGLISQSWGSESSDPNTLNLITNLTSSARMLIAMSTFVDETTCLALLAEAIFPFVNARGHF